MNGFVRVSQHGLIEINEFGRQVIRLKVAEHPGLSVRFFFRNMVGIKVERDDPSACEEVCVVSRDDDGRWFYTWASALNGHQNAKQIRDQIEDGIKEFLL